MKRWLIPVVILVLVIAGGTAAVLALNGAGNGGDGPASESLPVVSSDALTEPADCSQEDDIDACLASLGGDGVAPQPSDGDEPAVNEPGDPAVQDTGDLPTHNLGDGDDSACDPVPLRSDCGIDPNECNKVHNITACSGPNEDGVGPIVVPGGGTAHYEVVVRFNTSVEQGDIDATSDLLRAYDTGLDFIVQESWPPTGVANLQTDTPNFCDAIFDELASQSYITDFSCGPQQIFNGDVAPDSPVTNLPDVE